MMRLTPPTIPVFLLAVVLAALSVASLYAHIPAVQPFLAADHHRYWMMVVAFLILSAGVIFSGL